MAENNDKFKIRETYVLRSDVIENIKNILNQRKEKIINNDNDQKVFDEKFRESFVDILKKKSEKIEHKNSVKLSDINMLIKKKSQIKKPALPKLSIFEHRNEILEQIFNQTFTLISGDTGCGKSTQVPQMILDFFNQIDKGNECNIICTQPRRISAIALAERVAWERNEPMGKSIGYQIRLEQRIPSHTMGTILYCTTGVLLRKMETDQLLQKATHIILDEIHERSIELDLLIGLLKIVVKYNKKLKVILMSATFRIDEFVNYFGNCPVVQIPGSLYTVEELYLEDILQIIPFEFKDKCSDKYTKAEEKEFNDLIEPYAQNLHKNGKYSYEVVNSIKKKDSEGINLLFIKTLIFYIAKNKSEGAILIFLPGYNDIDILYHMIIKDKEYNKDKFEIYTLHSLMPTKEQIDIFKHTQKGVRKIILSTTIAETSITINDVVHVINPGRVKDTGYDIVNNYETLITNWISEAQFKQRKGRAGRCQSGFCYNLYTRARAKTFNKYPTSEIKRSRLEPVILRLKFMRIKYIYEFLQTLIDIPTTEMLKIGYDILRRINALDSNGNMTPIGYRMAHLPLDPQIAKMLVMSSIFDCVEPITSICATLSYKEPFYRPIKYGGMYNLKDIKLELARDSYSDEIMYVNVIEDYDEADIKGTVHQFVRENFISYSFMHELHGLKRQLTELLDLNKISNANANNEHLLKAIIAAGLFPNIAYIKEAKKVKEKIVQEIITPEDKKKVVLHKWCVNANLCDFDSKFLVYCRKRKGKNEICLYDSTMIFADSLFIFSDRFEPIKNENGEHIIKISDNIEFLTDLPTFEILKTLRYSFDNLITKLALNPKKSADDSKLLEAVTVLLSCDLD